MEFKPIFYLSLLLRTGLSAASWTTRQCDSDSDCTEPGDICHEYRSDNEKKGWCTEGCRVDADCPRAGWVCNERWSACKVPDDVECQTDDDCRHIEETICYSWFSGWKKTCKRGCRSDRDCQPGELCNDVEDPEKPKCDKDFCRGHSDCDVGENCVLTRDEDHPGLYTCVKDGCDSDTACPNDEICEYTNNWKKAAKCVSRGDCRTHGCDEGRFCMGNSVENLENDWECVSCKSDGSFASKWVFEDKATGEKYCSLQQVLADIESFLEPLDEKDKALLDSIAKDAGVQESLESCEKFCVEGGIHRTPVPTSSPTPLPTPNPTPLPTPSPTPSPTPLPYKRAWDKPKVCKTIPYTSDCTACPAHWYKSCDRRGVANPRDKSWEGCGFLGCRLTCEYDKLDYGCGCGKSRSKYKGVYVCK